MLIIDKYKKYYQNGFDYIIIIRNSYIDLNFEQKERDYKYLIDMINNYYKEKINEA